MAKVAIRQEPPARFDATAPPPGEGHVDANAEAIQGVRDAIGQAPGDAYGVKMRAAVNGACDAAMRCRTVLWAIADDFVQQRRLQEEMLRDVKEAAGKAVPTSGHMGGPQEYQMAVRAAQDAVEQTAAKSIQNNVLKKLAPRVDSAGAAFVQAMQTLSDEIDRAYADCTSPAGLREGSDSSLERIMKLSSIERGIRANERPAKEVMRLFEGFVARGEDEKVLDLIEATGSMLAEVRNNTARAGTGPRHSGGVAFDAGSERDIAFRLGRAFTDWARLQVPKSIKIANDCFEDMKVIFRTLVGADVRLLTPAQFAQRHLSGTSTQADSATPFQLEEDWTMRALNGRVPLSGWSPKTMTDSGAIIRAPKGR